MRLPSGRYAERGTVAVENCRDGARPVMFGRPCKLLIINNAVFIIEHGSGEAIKVCPVRDTILVENAAHRSQTCL
ncbi:MAG: hypothetical protein FWF09_03155 [Bacteroidales bacterium]|nr:hypothetical protein [Bacteroidales bacterium]